MKLNLGSSDRHFTGYLNVDIVPPADLIMDLTKEWKSGDSSVEEIRAWDIIEHLPDKIHTMNEAWRVLIPNGIFDIIVPTTDGRGAWQDPQHCSYWNINSFFYYVKGVAEYERFHVAYGIEACFRVITKRLESIADEVVKLHITLAAVK